MAFFRDAYNRTDGSQFCNGTSDEQLYINCSGYCIIQDESMRTVRPEGRLDYQLIFVQKGKVIVYSEEGSISDEVTDGGLILYKPMELQDYDYYADAEKSTEVYWVHFTGTHAEEILQRVGLLNGRIYPHCVDDSLGGYFRQIQCEIIMKHAHHNMSCVAIFVQMLAAISRMRDRALAEQGSQTALVLNPAIEDIKLNFFVNRAVKEYAAMCHLDSCYFITLFKKIMGETPIAYRTGIRITNAKDLLERSNRTVREIATMCGYDNALYFSRVFKKRTGLSPVEYRAGFPWKKGEIK